MRKYNGKFAKPQKRARCVGPGTYTGRVSETPRIVVFDTETTGTDKQRDQIVELCVQFGLEPDAPSKTWRIRPQVAMHPGAQAVHGISLEDLVDAPPFADLCEELRALFADADILVGYNLRFDIDMLQGEYLRLGLPPLDLADKLIVDPFRLWQMCEPRSLMDAHRRFVGDEFDAAHSAEADVAATGRVLLGMLKHFDIGSDWQEVADICEPDRAKWIGGTKHMHWDEDDRVVLAFGRNAGTLLTELASGPEADYLRWILDKDFPAHVHLLCAQVLRLSAEEFGQWAVSSYPPRRERAPLVAKKQAPPEPAPSSSVASEEADVKVAVTQAAATSSSSQAAATTSPAAVAKAAATKGAAVKGAATASSSQAAAAMVQQSLFEL